MLRNVVNKCNRKLMAAVSLVLAAKWNEPKVTPTIFQMPNPNPNPDPNPNPLLQAAEHARQLSAAEKRVGEVQTAP